MKHRSLFAWAAYALFLLLPLRGMLCNGRLSDAIGVMIYAVLMPLAVNGLQGMLLGSPSNVRQTVLWYLAPWGADTAGVVFVADPAYYLLVACLASPVLIITSAGFHLGLILARKWKVKG